MATSEVLYNMCLSFEVVFGCCRSCEVSCVVYRHVPSELSR